MQLVYGCIDFSKIKELNQNSTRQKDDMKKVPFCGPANIRRHIQNLRRLGEIAPGFVQPWVAR